MDKITVTFFSSGTTQFHEKEYSAHTGESDLLMAELDMYDHIRQGGYCLAEYNHKAVLVTQVSQLITGQKHE